MIVFIKLATAPTYSPIAKPDIMISLSTIDPPEEGEADQGPAEQEGAEQADMADVRHALLEVDQCNGLQLHSNGFFRNLLGQIQLQIRRSSLRLYRFGNRFSDRISDDRSQYSVFFIRVSPQTGDRQDPPFSVLVVRTWPAAVNTLATY